MPGGMAFQEGLERARAIIIIIIIQICSNKNHTLRIGTQSFWTLVSCWSRFLARLISDRPQHSHYTLTLHSTSRTHSSKAKWRTIRELIPIELAFIEFSIARIAIGGAIKFKLVIVKHQDWREQYKSWPRISEWPNPLIINLSQLSKSCAWLLQLLLDFGRVGPRIVLLYRLELVAHEGDQLGFFLVLFEQVLVLLL